MRGLAAAVVMASVLGAVLTGCSVKSGGEALGSSPTWEFDIQDSNVVIDPGDSFEIAVDDNASAGDYWSIIGMPDPAVVESDGDRFEADGSGADADGGGGKRYFRFYARKAGTTTIELRNCFRGCAQPGDDHRYSMVVKVGA